MDTPHLDFVTDPTVHRSLALGENYPRCLIFKKALSDAEGLHDFEHYEHPEKLILDDNYNEYTADGCEQQPRNTHALIVDFDQVSGSGSERIKYMIYLIYKRYKTKR